MHDRSLFPATAMPIKHLVVLMMENRSFDHALGYLKVANPASPVNGLSGNETNPLPTPPGGTEKIAFTAEYHTLIDPGHEYEEVVEQLFGGSSVPSPPVATNDGYVRALAEKTGSVDSGRTAMHCFDRARLPVLYALAEEYAVCDNWYSSVPGPTWPNRFFVHAASSNGSVRNSKLDAVLGRYNQPVIYDALNRAGIDWRLYFSDISQAWALKRMRSRQNLAHVRTIGHFEADARAGRLPPYTFIEPRYFNLLKWKGNDQHPGNFVDLGEHLIARVYQAVRASPLWDDLMLVIVYDEHGGFYDHASPPYDGEVVNGQPVAVKAPDRVSKKPPFKFDRLGPRVPAVLVSPRIPRGTVDHTVYEHASVPATIKEIFGLPRFLNHRDATVNTFAHLASGPPRTDTPPWVVRPPAEGRMAEYAASVMDDPEPAAVEAVRARALPADLAAEVDPEPPNDLQVQLLELAYVLDSLPGAQLAAPLRARMPRTETNAAVEVRTRVWRWLASKGVAPVEGPTEQGGTAGGSTVST